LLKNLDDRRAVDSSRLKVLDIVDAMVRTRSKTVVNWPSISSGLRPVKVQAAAISQDDHCGPFFCSWNYDTFASKGIQIFQPPKRAEARKALDALETRKREMPSCGYR
jgi:hypothetical protein